MECNARKSLVFTLDRHTLFRFERLVQTIAEQAASAVKRVVAKPAPVCNLIEFGDSSVNFDVCFWIQDPQNGLSNVRSEVLMNIWQSLKDHDIEIPFPQRDLHIKSWPLSPDHVTKLTPETSTKQDQKTL